MLERSILSTVLGLPGYAAIAIAFGFTGLGVFIDLNRINGLGAIFKGCYFAGCVLAVCWVKRRALFGPLVQPPLLLAIAVPSVVLLSGEFSATGSPGLADHLLSIGAPLLNGFPTMAVTTACVLAIGLLRYVLQRPRTEPVRRRTVAAQRSSGRRQGNERRSGAERGKAADRPTDPPGRRQRGGRRGADSAPSDGPASDRPAGADRSAERRTAERRRGERPPPERSAARSVERVPTERRPGERRPSANRAARRA